MKKFGIKQHDIRDCGAACIATVCRYHGLKVPLVKVREQMKVDKNGSSLYALAQTAEYYHFQAEVFQGTVEDLVNGVTTEELNLPLIAHLDVENYGHFVVIIKMTDKNLKVFDPAKGFVTWSISDFEKLWTGYIVTLEKNENFQTMNLGKGFLSKYFTIFKCQKGLLISILALSLVLSGITLVSSLAYQKIIDGYILRKSSPTIVLNSGISGIDYLLIQVNEILSNFFLFFLALIFIFIIQMLLNILKGYFLAKISRQINQRLIEIFLEKVMRLPISFFKDRETGEILSRFSDIGEIKRLISESGITIIMNTFMVITGALLLCYINFPMFGVALLIIAVYTVIVLLYKNPIHEVKRNIFESNSQLISKLKEDFDNIEAIKNIGNEEQEEQKLKFRNNKVLNHLYKGELISRIEEALLENVERIGSICILGLGSYLVIQQKLSLGNLIVFQSLLGFFIAPFQQLIVMQIDLQGSFISMDRLNDVLEVREEREIFTGTAAPAIKNSDIIYHGVTFGYNYDGLILKNLSFRLSYGKHYAIIGGSGSGKSTFARLLVQHYPIQQGKITIGNVDISDISLPYLRSRIKYVSADGRLFAGSILENLLMVRKDQVEEKTFEKVIIGCKLEEIFSELPFGINTKISENGSELSSGQRQRILLAQALLGEPEVLILDEGTSHLDAKNEKEIFDFIQSFCRGITCIFITHNKQLAESCDETIIIHQGKAVGQISRQRIEDRILLSTQTQQCLKAANLTPM